MAMFEIHNLSMHGCHLNEVHGNQYYNTFMSFSKETDEREAIADWLSPLNFETHQATNFRQRAEGTGKWFLESTTFEKWRDGTSTTLFCPGIPGAGKTIMSSIVINHLQRFFRDSGDTATIYAYLVYKEPAQQTPLHLVSSLLKQLIQRRTSNLDNVRSMYQRHENQHSQPTLDDIIECLNVEISGFSRVFIVVDGLDELSEEDGARLEFLKAIQSLMGPINLMVTSRDIPSIILHFEHARHLTIHADNDDVRGYVRSRIPNWYPKDLGEMVVDEIVNSTAGMFLLPRLHIESLRVKHSIPQVRQAIQNLPKGIDNAYNQAINRIQEQDEENRTLAFAVLSWIVVARRPLCLRELLLAVAMATGTELDPDDAIMETCLTSYCAGLVVVDELTKIARLVHYSAQQYFESRCDVLFPEGQVRIARTCLMYLSLDGFQYSSSDRLAIFSSLEQHPLLDYAARYWGHHARGHGKTTETALILKLLRCHQRRDFCAIIAVLDGVVGSPPKSLATIRSNTKLPSHLFRSPNFSILHLCAFFGLRETIEHELDNGAEADPKDAEGRTPLTWAAHNGHDEVVSLLMTRSDVDPNSRDDYGRTPLCWAAQNGHYSTMSLLLTLPSVNANTKDCLGRTPLCSAAKNGHASTVNLLLSHPAVDINLPDNVGRTPLSWAAECGHTDIVASLASRDDINVNVNDEDDHTPLSLAAENGHHGLVRLLLSHPAIELFHTFCNGSRAVTDLLLAHDIATRRQQDGWTVLSWAAAEGHIAVVKQVLAHKSDDVNVVDGHHRTPLHWAAQNGHDAIVNVLLAQNCVNVNANDAGGSTPLSLASANGRESTVSLFLKHCSIDVKCMAKHGWTPLHLAAHNRHHAVVDLLLAHDAVAYGSNDNLLSVLLLSAAARGQEQSVMKLLQQKSVDVNCKDRNGLRPLDWAAREKHDSVVDLLLAHGATGDDGLLSSLMLSAAATGQQTTIAILLMRKSIDFNCKDNDGLTPLHIATRNRHHAVTDLLLASEAIEVEDSLLSMLLLSAAARGKEDTVKILLAHKSVDVNCIDRYRLLCTPLHLAAFHDHDKVVSILLTHKAINVNRRNEFGWTPLALAAANGREATVKQLVSHPSIDVNCKNDVHSPIHRAVQNGHLGVLDRLLSNDDIDINARDMTGSSPLSLAAKSAQEAMAKLLSHLTIDPNSKNDLHCTPLHDAAHHGHSGIVDLLLSHHATDVNSCDKSGLTPLSLAAEAGNTRIVERLLAHSSIDINCKNRVHRTPLHQAACQGHHDVVGLLLRHHAIDVNARDTSSCTPLSLAAHFGKEMIVKQLLAHKSVAVNCWDSQLRSPIHHAARNKYTAIVELLLSHDGINPNFRDLHGSTPLSLAVENRQEMVAQQLLAHHSIDVNCKDRDSWTPLHFAVATRSTITMDLLLARDDIDVSPLDANGSTPLLLALEGRHNDIIQAFHQRYLRLRRLSGFSVQDVHQFQDRMLRDISSGWKSTMVFRRRSTGLAIRGPTATAVSLPTSTAVSPSTATVVRGSTATIVRGSTATIVHGSTATVVPSVRNHTLNRWHGFGSWNSAR